MKAPTPKVIAAYRAYAPQFFAHLDEVVKTAPAGDALYHRAYDIIRAVKRKRSGAAIFDVIDTRLRDLPEAGRLLWDDVYRRTPGGQAHYAELTRLLAVRKAGTLIAAQLLGLAVGTTRLEAGDDLWLREPAFTRGGVDDATAAYWAACCADTGTRCAEAALGDDDDLANYPEVDPDDGLHTSFLNRLRDAPAVASFIDYAILLEHAVAVSGDLEALAELLIARRALSGADLERFMFERDLVSGSLRVHTRHDAHHEVSLAVAPTLDVTGRGVYLERDDGLYDGGFVGYGRGRALQS